MTTNDELQELKLRAVDAAENGDSKEAWSILSDELPRLIAEIERLRKIDGIVFSLYTELCWVSAALQALCNAGRISEINEIIGEGTTRRIGDILDSADAVLGKTKEVTAMSARGQEE